MIKPFFLIVFSLIFFSVSAQKWQLVKDQDGIKVYQAEVAGTSYKNLKVECTLDGNYDKLTAVLTDVSKYKKWVYNNETAYVLKKINPFDFYYYSETYLPWPMSNRDAAVHMTVERDKQNRYLRTTEVSVPDFIPKKDGKVRVPKSTITWTATMPTPSTLHIVYVFEADPGGSIPAWMANSFADKGPFESFKKLREMLKN